MDIKLSAFFIAAVLSFSVALCCMPSMDRVKAKNKKENTQKEKQPSNEYHIDGSFFKDKLGRVRIFHGFNSVTKEFPWYSPNDLNETRLALFKEWGFNVVRLGCMWSGLQPNHGEFNQTYISILKEIINKAEKYGISFILDLHQDVLSAQFGTYDGIPEWLLKRLPPAQHHFPWPLPKINQWSDGYLTQAAGSAFQDIYRNASNSWSILADFWQKVAETFKDTPNILGYELINEPWAGDIYKNPSLLLPGIAGKNNLKPMYDMLNTAIRKVDNDAIIFYEPVTWGIFFNGSLSGSGFDSVPGGTDFQNKSCLSYHYYCWILGAASQHAPISSFKKAICDRTLGPLAFQTIKEDVSKTGGASFLTEFGLCDPDGHPNSTATVECTFVMQQADEHFQSWTYWDSGFFTKTGAIQWNIVRAFSRVYPRAIAGIPLKIEYEPKLRVFQLQYQPDVKISASTEIIVPSIHYYFGFLVDTSPGTKWKFDQHTHILHVYIIDDTLKVVNVQIIPFL